MITWKKGQFVKNTLEIDGELDEGSASVNVQC